MFQVFSWKSVLLPRLSWEQNWKQRIILEFDSNAISKPLSQEQEMESEMDREQWLRKWTLEEVGKNQTRKDGRFQDKHLMVSLFIPWEKVIEMTKSECGSSSWVKWFPSWPSCSTSFLISSSLFFRFIHPLRSTRKEFLLLFYRKKDGWNHPLLLAFFFNWRSIMILSSFKPCPSKCQL